MIKISYGLIRNLGKPWLLAVLCLLVIDMAGLQAQCLSATYGLWPSSVFTPGCTGSVQTITTCGYAGEYSRVNVVSGNSYVFSGSISSDFYTISNDAGTTSLAWGTGSVNWTATFTGTVRFYTHTNSACGNNDSCRNRTVACTGSAPPPNPPGNNCSNALNLATLTSPYAGTTAGFTDNFNISCISNTASDMIFFIDVPADNQLTITQVTNAYDSRVAVFYGGSCPGNTQIACWDDPDEQSVNWVNTTGSTQRVYWVQDGFSSGSGTFTISWSVQLPQPPPAGASCANPIVVNSFPYSTSNTTCGKLNDYGNQCGGNYGGGEDIVYELQIPAAGTYTIALTGTGGWAGWFLKSGLGCANASVCLANATSSSSSVSGNYTFTSGGTYYLIIDTWPAPNCTAFNLTVNEFIPPCNSPGTPSASGITPTTATLNWGAAAGASAYEYSFGPVGHSC